MEYQVFRVARRTELEVLEAAEAVEVPEVDHLAVEIRAEALAVLLEAPRQPLVHRRVPVSAAVAVVSAEEAEVQVAF